jgi:MFS transporter, ACS family, D-galactonate transporter
MQKVAEVPASSPTEQSHAQRWAIVGLLCLGMMIAYFDRINLSIAVADDAFKTNFGLTPLHIGTLNSAFFWSYFILQIPAGFFVDRFGVKTPYAAGFLLWSLLSAATAFATGLWQLITIRLLLGLGECVVTPAGMRWIRFNISEEHRGLAIGLYMAAAKFGPAVGAYLATILITVYGWQNMFLILGLGCLVWLAPWMMLVRDDDRQKAATAAAGSGGSAKGPSFGKVMASPVIWGTVVGTFCYQYFVYYCLTWLPLYFVQSRNLNLKESGLFTTFSFTGMAVVATAAGWAADRLIARGRNPVKVRKAFIFAGFALASTQWIGAISESNSAALFFAIFSLSGLGMMTANYWALTQTLIPGAAVGRIVGVQNAAANLPGIVAPLLTGWLVARTGSYEAPMLAIAVFLLLGIGSYLFLVREKYAPKGE